MMETIGWVGGILLAFCGIPQAMKSFRDKHSNGLAWGFILMWFFGEVLLMIYILPLGKWPLYLNYGANLILVSIILWFKVFPNRDVV